MCFLMVFLACPMIFRKDLLWRYRKPAKLMLLAKSYEEIDNMLTQCVSMTNPCDNPTFKKLIRRIN
jgi:hypothetical protein